MCRHLFVTLVIVTSSLVGAVPAQQPEPEVLAEQIRVAELDPSRAVELHAVDLDMGPAKLEFESGWLFPARKIAGSTMELVFVGEACLTVSPPDRIEATQLEIFTDQSPLDTAVNRAVLVVGNPSIASRLLSRSGDATPDPSVVEQATTLFDEWVASAERRGFGVDVAILGALFEDAGYRDYFAVLFESEQHGRFYYRLDPTQIEQVGLGQFVAAEYDAQEEQRIAREIRRARKRGRLTSTRVEDLGNWDTWMRVSLRDDAGEVVPGSAGFEPQHYDLDVTVDNDELTIDARATIDLLATADGRRSIAFSLFEDLEPRTVRDGEGGELAWFESDDGFQVLLPRAVPSGAAVRVTVEYGGVVLQRLEKGILSVVDTTSWYPHTGIFDRATYEVVLRWPKSIDLLASGHVVDSGEDRGLRYERRKLDLPSTFFGFEVGDFKVVERQVGHVALKVGFSKSTLSQGAGAKEDVIETLAQALAFYEERLGPYPLDYLTVATVPRGFSQGFMGFLTLSHYLMGLSGDYFGYDTWGGTQRRETVAHELAHQWWGNKVGWYNYRDQWLSEALADFSAVLFMAEHADRRSVYLTQHAHGWKRSLSRSAQDGRRVEALGPVVLGERLFSSHSSRAYWAIVYDKGSLVFSMLARQLGEEPLTQMLGHLATAVGNRAIDTEVFLKSLERMSGRDLSAFADRFIYGTGIPEVYYHYSFEENPEGGWLIEGRAQPIGTAGYHYSLKRTEAGHWDVERRHAGNRDISDLAVVVPFQIVVGEIDTAEAKKQKRMSGYATGRGFGGKMLLEGDGTSFSIPIAEKPTEFWLDQQGQVLAYFYSEKRAPKQTMRYRAMELTGGAKESLLKEALATPLMSEQVQEELGWSRREVDRRAKTEDAAIYLELGRLYLNEDREAEAAAALDSAEDLLDTQHSLWFRSLRDALKCRLAIRQGDYKSAYNILKGELWLNVPREMEAGIGDQIRRTRWRQGYVGDGEDYALLAVSAHETGHDLIARLAVKEAEQKGADMSPLLAVMAE